MSHDHDLTPEEQELFEALKRGAVVSVNESTGETKIQAHDDLPPAVRACFRASRTWAKPGASTEDKAWAREHWNTCPDCIESEAEGTLMDAAAHREEGNETTARELEVEAAELRLRAAKIRAASTFVTDPSRIGPEMLDAPFNLLPGKAKPVATSFAWIGRSKSPAVEAGSDDPGERGPRAYQTP